MILVFGALRPATVARRWLAPASMVTCGRGNQYRVPWFRTDHNWAVWLEPRLVR